MIHRVPLPFLTARRSAPSACFHFPAAKNNSPIDMEGPAENGFQNVSCQVEEVHGTTRQKWIQNVL
jgi:hypothetical protein